MSHEDYVIDKLSHRLPSLLPDFIRKDAPVFESFLKAYFEFLEAEILVLEKQSDLDGVDLEDGTGDLLLEAGTVSPSPDQDTSRIVHEATGTNVNAYAEPYKVGEFLYGKTSGCVAQINVINGNTLFLQTISGNGFSEGETVEGRDGLQTGIVKSYKENTILANNRLLDYSDIDHTTEGFLDYFQRDFIPSLDLDDTKNKRLTIKNINDLYQQKGTADSVKFLLRLLYGEDATVRYPIDETIFASDSDYNEQRRMTVVMDNVNQLPKSTDKIIQYKEDGISVAADTVIENVYVLDSPLGEYSLHVSNTHAGTFTVESPVEIIDRDGITRISATVKGVISGLNYTRSSTYIEHDDSGDLLFEDGTGILLESPSHGSLYSLNDKINWAGGKLDTDAQESSSVVNTLISGGVEKVYIETGGTDYQGGDLIVFDDAGTNGGGAEALIGAIEDVVIAENRTEWGQFEFTATAGQTLFSGNDSNGRQLFFNDSLQKVFIDGIEQTPSTVKVEHDYTFKNDRIVLTTGATVDQKVEIYTDFNHILYEDDTRIQYGTQETNVRSVDIINPGAGYEKLPLCWPGGYIYFDDLTGYQVDDVLTQNGTDAQATIVRIDTKRGRLVVKRLPTHTGTFNSLDLIAGAPSGTARQPTLTKVSSGTGAKLFAFSTKIGGVGTVNLQSQGFKFNEDAVVSNTSYFPMMITTPTATLNRGLIITGDISGTTAEVQIYDASTHVLTYKNLDGQFTPNETVSYNVVDEFRILRSNPYNARGLHAGEGIMQEQLLGDKSTTDATAANIHDSKVYQTHSYVIKVSESINKYRATVKDLVHPAGHIFFGEIAIENDIDTTVTDRLRFRPLLILNSFPTHRFNYEDEQSHGGLLDASFNILMETSNMDDFEAPSETYPLGRWLSRDHFQYLLNEDSPDVDAITEHTKEIEMYTMLSEINDEFNVLEEAGVPAVDTDPRTGGAITEPYTEYGDSEMRNRHINILKIVSVDESISQHSPRLDGLDSVLNLMRVDTGGIRPATNSVDYLVVDNTKFRSSDQGVIFQYGNVQEEELVYEDGSRIEQEVVACLLKAEPRKIATVKGIEGEVLVFEDGISIRLEDATTIEPAEYFTTERSTALYERVVTEEGQAILMESGETIIRERSDITSVYSFAPHGPTLRSLNTITGQRTYKISHYIKLDTAADAGDDIILEDGHGALLDERSEPEGLRIQDLDYYYPKTYIPQYDLNEKHRTNLAFSTYVLSKTA